MWAQNRTHIHAYINFVRQGLATACAVPITTATAIRITTATGIVIEYLGHDSSPIY